MSNVKAHIAGISVHEAECIDFSDGMGRDGTAWLDICVGPGVGVDLTIFYGGNKHVVEENRLTKEDVRKAMARYLHISGEPVSVRARKDVNDALEGLGAWIRATKDSDNPELLKALRPTYQSLLRANRLLGVEAVRPFEEEGE